MKPLSSTAVNKLLVLLSMSSEQQSPSSPSPAPVPSAPVPPCCYSATASIFIATSMDGFIADANNSVDWLNDNLNESHPLPEGDDAGYTLFMKSVDAIIMGRKTYETVLDFFLESSSGGVVNAATEWPYGDIPLYVLSRSPEQVKIPRELTDDNNNNNAQPPVIIKAISGDPQSVLRKVAEETIATLGEKNNNNVDVNANFNCNANANANVSNCNVYIDGGQCIRSFIDADLVESAIITRVPVTLGEGVSLFSTEEQKAKLQEISSITMENGFIQTKYKVLRKTTAKEE